MLEYVKKCPKCGHENPESEFNCTFCDASLVMVEAVRASGLGCACSSCSPVETQSLFSLEIPGTAIRYNVKNGDVIGQDHHTSDAEIKLSGIDGVNFVHRRHCRFEVNCSGEWFVTPIIQEDFSNPTNLNIQRLEPGQRYKITNGDKLTLGPVTFQVRII